MISFVNCGAIGWLLEYDIEVEIPPHLLEGKDPVTEANQFARQVTSFTRQFKS
jgi:hypothetical protein